MLNRRVVIAVAVHMLLLITLLLQVQLDVTART